MLHIQHFRIRRRVLSATPAFFFFLVFGCEPTISSYEERRSDTPATWTELHRTLITNVGAKRAQHLIDAVGPAELMLLAYGAGTSNIVLLINAVSDVNKITALLGSEFPPGAETGLGAVRVVALLNTVDAWMLLPRYDGALAPDQDTIARVAEFINGIPLEEVTTKVVALVESLGITRAMDDTLSVPNDQQKLDRIAQLIAHTSDVNKLTSLFGGLAPTSITTKLQELLRTTTVLDRLVEVIDYVTVLPRLQALLGDVALPSRLATILNVLPAEGATKVGYLVDSLSNNSALVHLIDNVAIPEGLALLIAELEDGTTWTGQQGLPQIWTGVPSNNDSGMARLLGLLETLVSPGQPQRLVQVLNQVTDPTALMRLIQDLSTPADLVQLITQLDDPSVDPEPTQNLGRVLQATELPKLTRLRELVDGQRAFGNTGDQAVYINKLSQLVSNLSPMQEGPLKVSQLLNGVSDTDKLIDLIFGVNGLSNLSGIINGINLESDPFPNNTAVVTLVYLVENLNTPAKLRSIVDDALPAQVVALVNTVATGSQWSDAVVERTEASVDDVLAAGTKLSEVINGTNDIADLLFVINQPANATAVAEILNNLRIAESPSLAFLLNETTGVSVWDPLFPDAATGLGKLVNIIDNAIEPASVATLLGTVANPAKLSDLINQVTNSSWIVSLNNAVDADPITTANQLATFIDLLPRPEVAKLSRLVTALGGTEDVLVAGLLAPYVANATQGVGPASLAALVSGLTDEAATIKLANLLISLNNQLSYLGAPVSSRVGLVRFLEAGVTYCGQNFPGLSAEHVAVMVNTANSAADLAVLLNVLGVESVVPTVGCTDRVGDPEGDGIGPFAPNFHTPCSACGLGW